MNEDTKRDIILYRCQKAKALLDEVELLLENKFTNSAVNRMYYACFHAVSALMMANNIEVLTHKGIRQLFGKHFVKTGIIPTENARIFSRIYDKRQASDYDDFKHFSLEEASQLSPQVTQFVYMILDLVEAQ